MPAQHLGRTPLDTLNTFGVHAIARDLWRVHALSDLPGLVAQLQALAGPLPFVLGGGSNLLLTGDVDAPMVQVALRGFRVVREDAQAVIVEGAAGESWDALVSWSLAAGLNGLQNLALIPGSVGAAPIQNIGAYGVELRDCFDSLDAMDLRTGRWRSFDAAECAFAYRHSVFKTPDHTQWLVCAVRFRLSRSAPLQLDYGDLRAELARTGHTAPSASDVAEAVRAIRRRKLPDPAVLGNAGSFFKNPVISAQQAAALQSREPGLPCWPTSGSEVKVSAAWMIDQCGWKGFRDGDAGVHTAHALVLVNHGHAQGRDILALALRIRDAVHARFGVNLEPEPVILGNATL